jgi:hypothetical protein
MQIASLTDGDIIEVFLLNCSFSSELVLAVPWWNLTADLISAGDLAQLDRNLVGFEQMLSVASLANDTVTIQRNPRSSSSVRALPDMLMSLEQWRNRADIIVFGGEIARLRAAARKLGCGDEVTSGTAVALYVCASCCVLWLFVYGLGYCLVGWRERVQRERRQRARAEADEHYRRDCLERLERQAIAARARVAQHLASSRSHRHKSGRSKTSKAKSISPAPLPDVSEAIDLCHKCKSPNAIAIACLSCGAPQPDGLNRNSIRFVRKNDGDDDSTEKHLCVVCLERFDESDRCVLLPCAHLFHMDCIQAWFERTDTCPICKQRLVDLWKCAAKVTDEIEKTATPKRKRRSRRTA